MSLLRRMLNLFSRTTLDHEIEDELRSHLEMRIDDNIATGMSAEEARRDALLRFGNLSSTREQTMEADVNLTLSGIWSDVRFGWRQLRRDTSFAWTAILVLALGFCGSVAIFAFVDAVLIKPLPYQNPSRLVALFESTSLGPRFHLSYLDYLDWKRQNKTFRSLEAYDEKTVALDTTKGKQVVGSAAVSAGFFRTLGVAPVLGRDFRDGEDTPAAARTAILSYAAWQNRYGGRIDILGEAIALEGVPYTVVGVLPQGFHFAPAATAEFWTALHGSSDPNGRGEHGLWAIARLRDGVTAETASSDMALIARQLANQYPDFDGGRSATVIPLTEMIVGNLRPILLLLLSGAILLLLIACVNVSGLMLVRSENRRHEMAVRSALGASRARLVQQLVTEGVMLAAAASLIGAGAAYGTIRLLLKLVPLNMLEDMPYLQGLGLNLHVVAVAAAVGLAMALLLSLMPVLRLSIAEVRSGLAQGGRSGTTTTWRRLGSNLVALELCTAMVLLVGAGLLGKSFYRLLHVDIGIQPQHLALLGLRAPGTTKQEQDIALTQRVLQGAGRLPGVQSTAITRQVPVANVAGGNTAFEIVGRPQHGTVYESNDRQVGTTYFSTVQARLARGRYFAETDDASKPRVAIVNQTFARRYFPGKDALGKYIRYDAASPVIEIVGVVDDIKEGPLDGEAQPVFYTPFDQDPGNSFFLVARTAQDPKEVLRSLETTIHRIDPDIVVVSTETMEDRINHTQSTDLHRSAAWLVGGFAVMALLLGIVGLYGVIAYSVSQRTKEIGVRMAMGAQRSSINELIMNEGRRLLVVGVMAGSICSLVAGNLIRKLLFGTRPWDLGIFTVVVGMLAVSTMAASYIPARRAASLNPVEALRTD
jgi:macrolide transport system ATP-binding/permease protein